MGGWVVLFAVHIAPPLWCQSCTLLLDFPPLDEHVADWQALKLNTPGCQIYDPIHFEAHLIPCLGSSPLCQFPDWPGHSLLSTSL